MKKTILVLAIGLAGICAKAQTLTPQVISTGGSYALQGNFSLSQTIGEMSAVQTLTQGNMILTQGFQQPQSVSTGILDFKAAGGSMALYPNPTADQFQLNYEFPKEGKLSISIYNMVGQKVSGDLEDQYAGGQSTVHMSASNLSVGMYFVKANFISNSGEQYRMTSKLDVVR